MNVVIAGQFDGGVIEALSRRHEVRHFAHAITDRRALAAAEVLVVRGHLRIDGAFLSRAPKLRLLVKAGAGLDTIDVASAEARGIAVVTTPVSATAVAELAILLLLAVRRRLLPLNAAIRRGRWRAKYDLVGSQLHGSTLGILGFGLTGRAVAHLAHGFGMTIRVYDRSPDRPGKRACAAATEARFQPLDDLLAGVDAVSLHLPLARQTRHLLGARELDRLPGHAVVINTARAALIDRRALVAALAGGRLAGAGLDVFHDEPVGPDDPLLAMPTVVATPHVGAQTRETHAAIGRSVVAAIEEFAASRR